MDIQRAIAHLVSEGLVLPYGLMPGSYPGGVNPNFDEERWPRFIYNPPPGLSYLPEYSAFDSEASAKPSWQEVVEADAIAELAETRSQYLRQLDTMATARIATLYHPDAAQDRNKEWQVRLSGITLTTQDEQRVQIVEIYQGLKADIMAASSLSELSIIPIHLI